MKRFVGSEFLIFLLISLIVRWIYGCAEPAYVSQFEVWRMSKIIELVDSTLSSCCARSYEPWACELPTDKCRIKASNSTACKRKKKARKEGRRGAAPFLRNERMRGNAKERTRGRTTETLSLCVCVSREKNTSINTCANTASLLHSALTSFFRVQFAVHATWSSSSSFEVPRSSPLFFKASICILQIIKKK